MEKWTDVKGYENIYEVSNKGRVRTCKDKTTFTILHGKRHWKQRILKDKTPNGRDVRVTLWKNNKSKDFLVHRLVAQAFIENHKNKYCINHKDGNPKNNDVNNLEWCTYSENMQHAFKNGLYSTTKKVTLVSKDDKEIYTFVSLAEGSRFLGKNSSYLSQKIINEEYDLDKYTIKKS